MVGTKLEFLPSWQTTWAQWKEMHPDTVALSKQGRRGARDTYDSYYASDAAGVIGETVQDDRLFTKEFVTGLELDKTVIAYPFSVLNEQPVLNDVVADTPVLVLFDPETAASAVYSRRVAGRTLTFTPTDEPLIVEDAETGTQWDAFTGEALTGPLAGQRLQRLKSTRSFWFGWKDIHPDTLVYEANE